MTTDVRYTKNDCTEAMRYVMTALSLDRPPSKGEYRETASPTQHPSLATIERVWADEGKRNGWTLAASNLRHVDDAARVTDAGTKYTYINGDRNAKSSRPTEHGEIYIECFDGMWRWRSSVSLEEKFDLYEADRLNLTGLENHIYRQDRP